MPSTNSLLQTLKIDYPDILFIAGSDFYWSHSDRTIHFKANEPDIVPLLLHELAHALLSHDRYERDVELIKIERDAWEYAKDHLAKHYDITIPDNLVETTLDTYRDWLHSRSVCPHCSAIGFQTKKDAYSCPVCRRTWRVNKAQNCALRRYKST